jgi:hypothetical protein
MNEKVRALFEAHVAHELEAFKGSLLTPTLEAWVRRTLEWLGELRLRDIAAPEQVLAIIDRYAVELRIGGGITELAGEMARAVLTSPASEEARVADIVPPASFEGFADKVASLAAARQEVLHVVAGTETYKDLVARTLERFLLQSVLPRTNGPASEPSLLGRLVPMTLRRELSRPIAALFSRFLEHNADRLARDSAEILLDVLDEESVRNLADDVWQTVGPMRLSQAFAFIDAHDLEDFVVLGHELWLKYRKSKYFRTTIEELVNYVFEKYRDDTFLAVMDDMGVTEEMVLLEVRATLAPLLARAVDSGFVEQRIRDRLSSFYDSDVAQRLFGA